VAFLSAAAPAQAFEPTRGDTLFVQEAALPPSELAELRGGFTLPSGGRLAFAIEMVTNLNGSLVSRLALAGQNGTITLDERFGDDISVTPQGVVSLSQFGDGAVVSSGALAGFRGIGPTIQNGLNNAAIDQINRIDVTIGNLSASSLRQRLSNAPGGF
jgi:hypothetical protein